MAMDILESVEKRRSIRAFKPYPVPQTILEELVERSLRAPSWGNTQPWDLILVTGTKLDEIKEGFASKAGQEPNADIARPQEFPEPYASRRRPMVRPQATGAPSQQQPPPPRPPMNPRFYNAPCLIYVCTGRSYYFQPKGINSWGIYDCGLISENIMLLAPNYGLGTIALAQAVTYPDVLRKVMNVPDNLLLVVGIAIGYPDWNDPINQRQSVREPMGQVVKWVGF